MARNKGKEKTIAQLYRENKKVLTEAGYSLRGFTAKMRELMRTNKTRVPGAWKAFKHSTKFTSKEIIGAENLWSGLNELGNLKQARKDVFGWKIKKEKAIKKLSWNKDLEKYTYDTGKVDKDGKPIIYAFELITGSYGSQYWKWSQI